jgi:hypothetical protein
MQKILYIIQISIVVLDQYIHSYLLTYATVQSPSWEANWFAASQEIPHISRNPKVHYRTHKRPPPVSMLGQPNPVHMPTSHLLEIYPNIIHPSTPRSPQWSLSLRFPHQEPIHPLSSPIHPTLQESSRNLFTERPPKYSDDTRCRTNTIWLPEDEHNSARNM